MKVKPVFFFFVFLCVSVWGYAQSGKLFSADMELSNSLINQIYQDQHGIIWIATEEGLNRYDGSKFTIYKHEESNPNSPLHNYVRTFFEDSKGNFYIGYFNGLQVYDYATDTFTQVPLYLDEGVAFNVHVITMLERKNGQVIVATSGQGYFAIELEENKLAGRQIQSAIPSDALVFLFEDEEENLWISTDDKGLFRIDRHQEITNFFCVQKWPKDIISGICQNRSGELFIGSLSTGLYRFDKGKDLFTTIPYPANPNLPVKTLHIDQNDDIYIGTDGCGIKLYTSGSRQVTDKNFNIVSFDFSKSKVHSILKDRSGNIWLGIFQKGVMLLPALSNKFGYIGYKSVINNIIGSNTVMSICRDHEGMIWIGTDSDGLYGIDENRDFKVHYAPANASGSVPATIMCVFEDSETNLWLGSYLHGLVKVNKENGQCEYVQRTLESNQYPIQRVYSLAEDDNKTLWIGTMGEGLFYMDIESRNIIQYRPADFNNTDYQINAWINCLLKTSNDRLYVGTYDGVWCIDLKNRKLFSGFNSPLPLLSGQIIYTLYEDNKGMLWIGTSRGLVAYNQETETTEVYTTGDGLPGNVICAIKSDEQGCLWISTNYGISRFNPAEKTFTNYYSGDGLQGNEFSKNAVSVNSNGQIMFGGLSGITYFNPSDITEPEKELSVRITDFYIHDEAVRKGMKSGAYEIIDASVMDAQKFCLSHTDNSFTIEFSTMEFINPERITYSYSMNSDNWIRLRPGTNRVSFNNLAPGKYQFKVMAQDYNVSSEVRKIDVVISPAWYASGWAKLLYWLISMLIMLLVIQQIRQRYKSRRRMQEHIRAKEINDAKLEFFTNISHEIRTPISLVISPLRKLMAVDEDCERQKAYLIMNRNVERVLNLINQLMDIRKIDRGQMKLKFSEVDMVVLINEVCAYFEDVAAAKQIEFLFQHDMDTLTAWVDSGNFDKVIMNVLSNAFKYTAGQGRVVVHLGQVSEKTETGILQNYAEIIVSDNGVGIVESEIETVFERFYQSKGALVGSNEGTGVGLHLTRSIVELHHGSIRAENNRNGKGCSFIIRLPLGNSHLKPEEMEKGPSISFRERHTGTTPVVVCNEEETKIKPKSKRYILVVDDDEEMREYICNELAADYRTLACSNGKEALEAILKKTPDLVISDVVMPEMDGITLCRKIKQNVTINHVPVILLTAKSKEEDNLEGLDTGADAYIIKPFNVEILKKTVWGIVKNREMLRNNYSGSQLQHNKIKKIKIKSTDDKLMDRIMKVINDNISNTNLNVEMIATKVGISRVHLHRKLKELTNQSTRDLIRNIRLQQAAALLSTKNLSITEVAEATGFVNPTHFSTSFKEMYGMSPMAYMEKHLNERGSDKGNNA